MGDHRVPPCPHGRDRVLAQRRDRAGVVGRGLDRAGDDAGRELGRIGVDGAVDEREVGAHGARRVEADQPEAGDRREQRRDVSRRVGREIEQLAIGGRGEAPAHGCRRRPPRAARGVGKPQSTFRFSGTSISTSRPVGQRLRLAHEPTLEAQVDRRGRAGVDGAIGGAGDVRRIRHVRGARHVHRRRRVRRIRHVRRRRHVGRSQRVASESTRPSELDTSVGARRVVGVDTSVGLGASPVAIVSGTFASGRPLSPGDGLVLLPQAASTRVVMAKKPRRGRTKLGMGRTSSIGCATTKAPQSGLFRRWDARPGQLSARNGVHA